MKGCLGIRHESKDPRERRAPLTPEHVDRLVRGERLRVIVQPSPTRVFGDEEYAGAGAEISNDLTPCNVILGVKEVPRDELLPAARYLFFSHTIKAQPYNMPMLRRILDQGGTLLDYELIKNRAGRRLVAFGAFAGYAGMVNTLWALGRRLKSEGISNPFERIRRPHRYPGLAEIHEALAATSHEIRGDGLPSAISPLVCGVTGHGRVAQGALSILKRLPTERVRPEELAERATRGDLTNRVIYRVQFYQADMYEPCDGLAGFNRYRFRRYPQRFRSRLPRVLPRLGLLVNGIYWEPRYPRLVTRDHLRRLWEATPDPRLRVIGDITCDVEGSIEVTVRPTTIDAPVFVYDPLTGETRDGVEGRGPVVMAVDKLPTELPRPASQAFGDALAPFASTLAGTDFDVALDRLALPPELAAAVIVHRGSLTPSFFYLSDCLQ